MVKLTELKCWRWLPGMKAIGRRGIPDAWIRMEAPGDRLAGEWKNGQPDLTDPATQGAIVFGLLAPLGWRMARGAWGKAAFTHRQHGFTEWLPLPEAIEAALRMGG